MKASLFNRFYNQPFFIQQLIPNLNKMDDSQELLPVLVQMHLNNVWLECRWPSRHAQV